MIDEIIEQCKEIPDKPIMEFLLKHKGHWCNWYFEDDRDVRNVMPKNLASEKLILAKMRQLMKRGLVDGCSCGCRGDFEITTKGEEWLSFSGWLCETKHSVRRFFSPELRRKLRHATNPQEADDL